MLSSTQSMAAPLGEPIDPWGAGGLVLASLSWAIGSLYARRASAPRNPLVATAMQMICGGGLQVVIGLLLGEPGRVHVEAFTWRSIAAFVYLIVLGSWIGFTCYVWLLRVVSPSKVATYAYVNPIVAVLLGWAILDERLTIGMFGAMALIIAGVILITMNRRPSTT
jgi:drug/metabolite transporter (DMT)-like permease